MACSCRGWERNTDQGRAGCSSFQIMTLAFQRMRTTGAVSWSTEAYQIAEPVATDLASAALPSQILFVHRESNHKAFIHCSEHKD